MISNSLTCCCKVHFDGELLQNLNARLVFRQQRVSKALHYRIRTQRCTFWYCRSVEEDRHSPCLEPDEYPCGHIVCATSDMHHGERAKITVGRIQHQCIFGKVKRILLLFRLVAFPQHTQSSSAPTTNSHDVRKTSTSYGHLANVEAICKWRAFWNDRHNHHSTH